MLWGEERLAEGVIQGGRKNFEAHLLAAQGETPAGAPGTRLASIPRVVAKIPLPTRGMEREVAVTERSCIRHSYVLSCVVSSAPGSLPVCSPGCPK